MTVATEAQKIYLAKISEAITRLDACTIFLNTYSSAGSVPMLEAAALQARKALEAVAYAAIAPNKNRYSAFREQAERAADYRKDYNARSILRHLDKINPDFYPLPLLPAVSTAPGRWHFETKQHGFLTRGRFEVFYDRLGKFLHADNPWGNDKGFARLAADLPGLILHLRELLALHRTVVRTPDFSGVWIVEVPNDGRPPHLLTGQALGEFAITRVAANNSFKPKPLRGSA